MPSLSKHLLICLSCQRRMKVRSHHLTSFVHMVDGYHNVLCDTCGRENRNTDVACFDVKTRKFTVIVVLLPSSTTPVTTAAVTHVNTTWPDYNTSTSDWPIPVWTNRGYPFR